MPNWCINKLLITGPDIPELMKKIGIGNLPFAFELIAPMPDPLDMFEGTDKYIAIAAAARSLPMGSGNSLNALECLLLTEAAQKVDARIAAGVLRLSNFYDQILPADEHALTLEEVIEVGKVYLGNYAQYRAGTWYDWRVAEWGTKWELDESTVVKIIDDHAVALLFDTAWSPPIGVVAKMGERFPAYKFRLSWHESGNNIQGVITVKEKNIHRRDYATFSEGRYERDIQECNVPANMIYRSKRKKPEQEPTQLPEHLEQVLRAFENHANFSDDNSGGTE